MGVWIETQAILNKYMDAQVTPYVGVWIETLGGSIGRVSNASHPTWVCGLKQQFPMGKALGLCVTPYVGVWIETD